MCGIVGAIGKSINKEILRDLFVAIEKRGTDASGFWTPAGGVVKAPVKVSDLVLAEKDKYEEGVTQSNLFIGHTRWATHGKINDNNNTHPLESENWFLVHNGVVASLRDVKDYPYKGGTDSENILAYIETFGLEKGLSKIDSGASIILVPKDEENSLYLWKTWSGDMAVCFFKEDETLYIVSSKMYFEPIVKGLLQERKLLGGLVVEHSFGKKIMVTEPTARQLWKITYENEKLNATQVATIPSTNVAGTWNGNVYTPHKIKDPDEDMFVSSKQRVRPASETSTTTFTKNGANTTDLCPVYTLDYDHDTDLIFLDDVVRLVRMPSAEEWTKEIKFRDVDGVEDSRVNDAHVTPGESFDLDDLFIVDDFIDVGKDCFVIVKDEINQELIFPIEILEKAAPPPCFNLHYGRKTDCNFCMFVDKCEDFQDQEAPTIGTCIGKYNYEHDDCKKCEGVAFCIGASHRVGF